MHHFLSEVARGPETAAARTRRVVVAAPARPGAADWIADALALGPALLCAAVDHQYALPAAFAGRLDVLVWCADAAAPRAADLQRAVAAMRPLRIVVLVVPAAFVPGGPPDAAAAPALGGLRAALSVAVADRPLTVACAGWSGEPVAEALEALAGRLLRDPPGGEHQR